jgi:hypothetical protein
LHLDALSPWVPHCQERMRRERAKRMGGGLTRGGWRSKMKKSSREGPGGRTGKESI